MATEQDTGDTWMPWLEEARITQLAKAYGAHEATVTAARVEPRFQEAILILMQRIKQKTEVFELHVTWKLAAIKLCSPDREYENYIAGNGRRLPSRDLVVRLSPEACFPVEEVGEEAGRAAVDEIMKVLGTRALRDLEPMMKWRTFCALMYIFGIEEEGVLPNDFPTCVARIGSLLRFCRRRHDADELSRFQRWPELRKDVVRGRDNTFIWFYEKDFAEVMRMQHGGQDWLAHFSIRPLGEEGW